MDSVTELSTKTIRPTMKISLVHKPRKKRILGGQLTLEESTLSLVRKLKKLSVHGFQITDPNNYDFFFGGKNPREVC